MSEIKVNSIKGVGASAAAITVNNTDGTCTANITNKPNRNLIINGAMQVAQRGTSATGLTSGGYQVLDRWNLAQNQGTVSLTQSTDAPDGFGFSYKVDVTTAASSLNANAYFYPRTLLEGQDLQAFAKGTSSAKEFTISFYAKSTKTGQYTVQLYDMDNNRGCSKSYTISNTNWNKYTLTFPADTTGTFDNDNVASLFIQFILAVGSDRSSGTLQTTWATNVNANQAAGNVNFLDNTANDFYFTGVQLEVGSVATDFEHRSFGQELALCQRYYHKMTGSQNKLILFNDYNNATNNFWANVYLPTTMRAAPTLTATGISGGDSLDSSSTSIHLMSLQTSDGAKYIGNGTVIEANAEL